MSNVTAIKTRQHMKLDKLEADVIRLHGQFSTARQAVGVKLLEIFESDEWLANHSSFTAYLEDFQLRLVREGVTFDYRDMNSWYKAAEFDKRISGQKLRKAERVALDAASPSAKKNFSELVRKEIKNAPAPISEAQAVRQLWDSGYFDPEAPQPITARSVDAAKRLHAGEHDPAVLAHQLKMRLNAVLELIEGYTDLGSATDESDVRHAARQVYRLLGKFFNLGDS